MDQEGLVIGCINVRHHSYRDPQGEREESAMKWIVAGLLVWWWLASRSKSMARRAERATQCSYASSLEQNPARAPHVGPWVLNGVLMAVTERYAYWRSESRLVRAPWDDGCADIERAEWADPLECDDLPPALVMEILDALDAAEYEIRHPRTHL